MRILAFDQATMCGVASGESLSNDPPSSDQFRLKDVGADIEEAAREMGRTVRDSCETRSLRPELIVHEAFMPIFNSKDDREGERDIGRGPASIDLPRLLVGAIHGVAACYGVRVEKVYASSARKHFTGRGNWGGPDASKAASRDQCVLLGYVKPGCRKFDQTDALCIWEYAAYTWGGRIFKPAALPFHRLKVAA